MTEELPDPASIATAALKIAEEIERDAYIVDACAGNEELVQQVRAIIRTRTAPTDNDALAATLATDGAIAGSEFSHAGSSTETYQYEQHSDNSLIGGKYRLVKRIGEGGMGSVWAAEQREPVKRSVALKLIKSGMNSRDVLARFDAERQALALMDHPNIARIYDGGLTDTGSPYFVMELVKGVPITEYCDKHRLTPQQRLELFIPVCQAIQHAHHKGIIHRDIKPSNVLVMTVDDKPVAKVIDFGVAKATGPALTEMALDTGFAVVGTPQYMSPEQASMNHIDIDTRSDVYSLGILLYELLAGSPPFKREELAKAGYLEILRVIREEEPPRPSTKLSTAEGLPSLSASRGTDPKRLSLLLRNELDWIVMRALEKDRSRRYETANAFAMDISRYLNGEPVQAHPPSTAYRAQKFLRKNRGKVIAASLVAGALVLGFIGTSLGMIEAFRQAGLAKAQEMIANSQTKNASEQAALAKQRQQLAIAALNTAEMERALAQQRLISARQTISAVVNNIPNLLERVPLASDAQSTILKQMDSLLSETDQSEQADADFDSSRAWGRLAVETRTGLQFSRSGNLEQAEAHFQHAMTIAKEVYQGNPRDRAKAAGNLAAVHVFLADITATKDTERAIELVNEAIRLRQEAFAVETAEDPIGKRRAQLGATWNSLVSIELQVAEKLPQLQQAEPLAAAMHSSRTALDMLQTAVEELQEDPINQQTARRDLAAAAMKHAKVAEQFNDEASVLEGYDLAKSNFKLLMEQQPERLFYQIMLADISADYGDYLLVKRKDPAAARVQYVDNMKILRKLNADHELNQLHQKRAMAYYRLGLAAEAQSNPEQVKRYFERSCLLTDIYVRERSDEPDVKEDPTLLVGDQIQLMLEQAWAGQAEPAVRMAREIKTQFGPGGTSASQPTAGDSLARAAFALAIVAEKGGLTETSVKAAQQEALDTLASARAAGYDDEDYLFTDPDVAPLRRIEGFTLSP